jgi:hypothetical protein
MTFPVFLHFSRLMDAIPQASLSWGSTLLHGLSWLLRPRVKATRATLMGFCAPSAHRAIGVHVSSGCPNESHPFEWYQRVPPHWFRCRSQAFATSQRFAPPLAGLPCFRQVTLMGFCPSGVFSSHKAAKVYHLSLALLTLLPQTSAHSCGHANCDLGPSQTAPFRLQGLRLCKNHFSVEMGLASKRKHPLLDFHLLMVLQLQVGRTVILPPPRFEAPNSVAKASDFCVSR